MSSLLRTLLGTASLAVSALSGAGCMPDYAPPGLLAHDASAPGPDAQSDTSEGSDNNSEDPGDTSDGADLPGDQKGSAYTSDDTDAGSTLAPDEPLSGCDLSGRWLVTEHLTTSALGAQQATQTYWYLEIAQTGSDFTIETGLACGMVTHGLPPIVVTVDMSDAFAAVLARVTAKGRRGSSTEAGSRCSVAFEKLYYVYGATVPHYLDPSLPLPTASQEATADQPGWEDWDDDGKPGVSLYMTGTITGALYTTTRSWTRYEGTVAAGAQSFTLPVDWNQEKVTLGLDGSPLLDMNGVPDSDKSLSFVELARLGATQATGDATAICAAVRKLAPTLTPTATQ